MTGKLLIMLHFLLIINLRIGLLLCKLIMGILIFLFTIILKKLKRKTRSQDLKFQSKPWINSGLQKSIVIKNKLFDKFIKNTNPIIKEKLHSDYKSYRNMISALLKQSKKNYYDKYFKDNINNMKNTWEGIRSIISLQKATNDSPTTISLEDHTVTDPRTIANTFNSFSCSVAAEFHSEVPFSYKRFSEYLLSPKNHFSSHLVQ